MNTKENQSPALRQEFVHVATDILSHFPDVVHEWSIDEDGDHCVLHFPKRSHDGFRITVEVFSNEIIVNTDGPQFHFDLIESPKDTVDEVLGFVRDLLSPDMRIVQKCANSKPYKWSLQVLRDGKWHAEQNMALLIFNVFGRRSEIILTNRVLPGRLNASDA